MIEALALRINALTGGRGTREIKRFIKFGVVGTSGFLVDFVVLNLLLFGVGLPPWLANTCSFAVAVTNTFTFADSKNSGYLDLSATFEVMGVSLTPHVGHQSIKHNSASSYTDYSLTVSKDFNGLVPSLAVVGTDADFYLDGKKISKTGVVLGLKYNF